jgi:hypothetical protein
VRKKIWSRSRREKNFGPSPGEKKILVPVAVPAKKSLRSWSRSRQKQILGEASSQKYFCYGLGPKKNILVLVLFRKNFGPGPARGPTGTGTTLLISRWITHNHTNTTGHVEPTNNRENTMKAKLVALGSSGAEMFNFKKLFGVL